MTLQVLPFHHADNGTLSDLERDAGTRAVSAVGPMLDRQAAPALASTASLQPLVDAGLERCGHVGSRHRYLPFDAPPRGDAATR